ncbi:MAG: tRNA guanosine(34) transglycosylase Tgt [Candidatus Falkowbacteria bacterium]|nr:tRNA guanosine(34) transglycosylase Tgt [Patescibacteria group bacterium]
MNKFKIIKQSKISKARIGVVNTEHGKIQTPFFMPDATRAAVKSLNNTDLEQLGLQSMVCNTYHLYLQPEMSVIKKAKSVHNFMNWNKPLLSDSGGFQVYSLIHKNNQMGRITDKEVIFKSPLNGALHKLTPEKSIQIQFALGTDMIVCLDDCPPHNVDDIQMKKSVERTIAWAKRCKQEYDKQCQKHNRQPLLFGVIQGGTNLAMRKKCAEGLLEVGFHGYGFGARPIDTDGKFLDKVLDYTADLIPAENLRFGLGIGTPEDIVCCAQMGWDMFDCVIPTREGRHGRLFLQKRNSKFQIPNSKKISNTKSQNSKKFYDVININNAKFKKDLSPINVSSKLPELREHSKAYLHHLLKTKEVLGARLASLNNLEFYLDLMKKIRAEIKSGRL